MSVSNTKPSSASTKPEKKEIDLDLIKSETLKALNIASKAQGDEAGEVDPVFSATFAKQYLDVRYNNAKAFYNTLEGVYLVRGLEYEFQDDAFVLDLIFAPKIISIADTKIRLFVKDGEFVEPQAEEEED
jgi:hypothetical protein